MFSRVLRNAIRAHYSPYCRTESYIRPVLDSQGQDLNRIASLARLYAAAEALAENARAIAIERVAADIEVLEISEPG
jgi:hypothetical protein